jgi:hypothetical protein
MCYGSNIKTFGDYPHCSYYLDNFTCDNMFRECKKIEKIPLGLFPRVSSSYLSTNANTMFATSMFEDSGIITVTEQITDPITGIVTPKITGADFIYRENIFEYTIVGIIDASRMFAGSSLIKIFYVFGGTSPTVTKICGNNMFSDCEKLVEIETTTVGTFNNLSKNVIELDLTEMFNGCVGLTSLLNPLNGLVSSNVITLNMTGMFINCTNLEQIPSLLFGNIPKSVMSDPGDPTASPDPIPPTYTYANINISQMFKNNTELLGAGLLHPDSAIAQVIWTLDDLQLPFIISHSEMFNNCSKYLISARPPLGWL